MATLETPPTPLRVVGVIVAFAGIVWYSVYKLNEQLQIQKEADAANSSHSDGGGHKSMETTHLLRSAQAPAVTKESPARRVA